MREARGKGNPPDSNSVQTPTASNRKRSYACAHLHAGAYRVIRPDSQKQPVNQLINQVINQRSIDRSSGQRDRTSCDRSATPVAPSPPPRLLIPTASPLASPLQSADVTTKSLKQHETTAGRMRSNAFLNIRSQRYTATASQRLAYEEIMKRLPDDARRHLLYCPTAITGTRKGAGVNASPDAAPP